MAELPFVSDHAVLRYLERSCGVPIEEIRRAIAKGCARGASVGAPCVRFAGGRVLVIEGRVVTTLNARVVPHWGVLLDLMGKGGDDG